MKTRKELKQAYRERPQRAGVFQVKNTANGKLLLGSSLNLDGPLNGHKFALSTGSPKRGSSSFVSTSPTTRTSTLAMSYCCWSRSGPSSCSRLASAAIIPTARFARHRLGCRIAHPLEVPG